MRNIILTTLILSLGQTVFGQVNDGLIELGKTYRQFMFRNNPPEAVLASLDKYDETELSFVGDFIKESVTPGSQILSDKYLNKPTDKDLKFIYIVERVNVNVRKENPEDNNTLVASKYVTLL